MDKNKDSQHSNTNPKKNHDIDPTPAKPATEKIPRDKNIQDNPENQNSG